MIAVCAFSMAAVFRFELKSKAFFTTSYYYDRLHVVVRTMSSPCNLV